MVFHVRIGLDVYDLIWTHFLLSRASQLLSDSVGPSAGRSISELFVCYNIVYDSHHVSQSLCKSVVM